MALLDNRFAVILLCVFVFYMLTQMNNTTAEHMDTVVNVDSSGTQVKVGGETIAQIPSYQSMSQQNYPSAAEENAFSNPPFASALLTPPSVTGALQSNNVPPAPLTAVEEQLLASAPTGSGMLESGIFDPQPVDYDEIFDRRDDLDPSELIPKADVSDLYGDIKEDPRFAGNFLTNAFQLGIETSGAKRSFVHDLRGAIPIQQSIVSPWLNSTRLGPDLTRKSLGDIS